MSDQTPEGRAALRALASRAATSNPDEDPACIALVVRVRSVLALLDRIDFLESQLARTEAHMDEAMTALVSVGAMVTGVRDRYPEDVFPPPVEGCSVDRYSAAGARIACDSISRLLRGEE